MSTPSPPPVPDNDAAAATNEPAASTPASTSSADNEASSLHAGGGMEEMLAYQRDVAVNLARKLAQDLEAKRTLLGGRLENALRLCAEAEVRLGKANREYQSKHLTLRKRMLTVVATLALASFIGWSVCAFITQWFPLGALLIFPVSLLVAVHLFGRLEGEEGKEGPLKLIMS